MTVELTIGDGGHAGLVAEGSNLWLAAKRIGVRLVANCEGKGECDSCALKVTVGADLLSPVSQSEVEHLAGERIAAGERLACQCVIERAGAVKCERIALADDKEPTDPLAQFRNEFSKMSLDRKIASLFALEKSLLFKQAVNLPDVASMSVSEEQFRREFFTLTTQEKLQRLVEFEGATAFHTALSVLNLPYTVGDKLMDVLAQYGRSLDAQAQSAKSEKPDTDPDPKVHAQENSD